MCDTTWNSEKFIDDIVRQTTVFLENRMNNPFFFGFNIK